MYFVGAVRRDNGGAARDHADHAANFTEEVETISQERIWCIFEDVPVPEVGGDATSLPPPDGVAGALAWLSRWPARGEQPLVQHTSHGHRLRWVMQSRRDGDALIPRSEQDVSKARYVDGVRHGVPDYVYAVIVESNALFSLSTSLAVPGAVDDDVFPRQVMESYASSFLCRPAVGWFPGEVDALDSHEHSRSDLRKSL